jgi:hypothetical protein
MREEGGGCTAEVEFGGKEALNRSSMPLPAHRYETLLKEETPITHKTG